MTEEYIEEFTRYHAIDAVYRSQLKDVEFLEGRGALNAVYATAAAYSNALFTSRSAARDNLIKLKAKSMGDTGK